MVYSLGLTEEKWKISMSPDVGNPVDFKRQADRLRDKLNILLLASVKRPVLLDYEVSSTFTKQDIHEYDRVRGSLRWNFSKGDRLHIEVNGSGLVFIEGKIQFGLDHKHRDLIIPHDCTLVEIEINESGELGSHKNIGTHLNCVVYKRDEELYSLFNLFQVAVDMVRMDERWEFLEKIEEIFKSTPLLNIHPLSYVVHSEAFSMILGEGLTGFDPYLHLRDLIDPNVSEVPIRLDGLKSSINEVFKEINDSTVSQGRPEVVPLGNAHIDLAWLWPVAETREKIRRTFSTTVDLLQRRNFIFLQSMVSHYEIIREMDPEIYAKIKKLIPQKKWVPVGGMIVEPDCNLIGGESLVRQVLYGQQFFKHEFGRYSNVAWLPDTFGYTGQLPQILVKTGFEIFVTTKFTYNDTTHFPHDIFKWEGADGSIILAHSHMRDYISDTDMSAVKDTIEKNPETSNIIGSVPLIFGYGDGGGGPSDEMIDRIQYINTARKTFYSGEEPLSHWVTKVKEHQNQLPLIRGELYLEAHRGTYTTHADIKKINRRVESELFVAEAVQALDGARSENKLLEEWKVLLRNQFHDILPGSAIDEAYRISLKELTDLSEHIRKEFIGTKEISGSQQTSFNVFSPFSWKTVAWVPLSKDLVGLWVKDASGNMIPVLNDGLIGGFYANFDRGMGYYTYTIIEDRKNGSTLTNKSAQPPNKWKFSIQGNKINAVSYEGNELPIPQLFLFNDFPYYFDAWELDDLERKHGLQIEPDEIGQYSLKDYGEVIEEKYDLKPGNAVLRLILPLNEKLARVQLEVDWEGYNRLLRMYIKVGNGRFLGESAYSTVERESDGTHYEFPAHRFVAVENDKATMILLNDSKYGYSYRDGYIGVSLLRAPFWPDPFSDRGRNSFSFAYGFLDERDPATYSEEGIKFNTHPFAVRGGSDSLGHLLIRGAVLGSFKISEDRKGKVLRLYNPTSSEKTFTVDLPFEVLSVTETDLLESEDFLKSTTDYVKNPRKLEGTIRSHEIKTLKLTV